MAVVKSCVQALNSKVGREGRETPRNNQLTSSEPKKGGGLGQNGWWAFIVTNSQQTSGFSRQDNRNQTFQNMDSLLFNEYLVIIFHFYVPSNSPIKAVNQTPTVTNTLLPRYSMKSPFQRTSWKQNRSKISKLQPL